MSDMDKLKKMAQEHHDMKKQARRDKKTIDQLDTQLNLCKGMRQADKDEIEQLQVGICCYAREELGNMNFENDQEVIDYILSFAPPKEVAMKTPNLTPNSRNKKAPPEEEFYKDET